MSARKHRAWTPEEIRHINTTAGPTPETAAILVEQGMLSRDDAAFLAALRRSNDAFMDWKFERRLAELQRAYRERPRTKTRIEDRPEIRDLYGEALKLRAANPRMTWDQVAARVFISRSQLLRWHQRFQALPGENTTIRD